MDMKIANQLAEAFREEMRREIPPGERAVMDLLNEQDGYSDSVCYSHDYCDANMVMDAAVRRVLGEDADVVNDDNIRELWNTAWDIAKRRGFSPGFSFRRLGDAPGSTCVTDRFRAILFNAVMQLKEGYLDTGLCSKGTYAHDIFLDVYNVYGWLTEEADDHPDAIDLADSCRRMDGHA